MKNYKAVEEMSRDELVVELVEFEARRSDGEAGVEKVKAKYARLTVDQHLRNAVSAHRNPLRHREAA